MIPGISQVYTGARNDFIENGAGVILIAALCAADFSSVPRARKSEKRKSGRLFNLFPSHIL